MGFEILSSQRSETIASFYNGRGGGKRARERQSTIILHMKSEVETEVVGPGTPRQGSKCFSATSKLPEITVTNLCRPVIFQDAIYTFISTN